MIDQFIKGKVYVFIDAKNVFYSQRTLTTRGHIAKELLERAKFIDLRKLRDEFRNKKSGATREGTPECHRIVSLADEQSVSIALSTGLTSIETSSNGASVYNRDLSPDI